MSIQIPTWASINERVETSKELDRINLPTEGELNPIEIFIHCQEPGGELSEGFRRQLQAMLDFVTCSHRALTMKDAINSEHRK